MSGHSVVLLEDGAKLAYQILGAQHLGSSSSSRQPIVLVGGISSTRGDFERLSDELAKSRPGASDLMCLAFHHETDIWLSVLIFDHRGLGTPLIQPRPRMTISPSSQWRATCIITLQLLFLPYIANNPKPLPFKITHVFLTATLTSVLKDKNYGVRLNPLPTGRELTPEMLREFIKPQMELMFDPKWLADTSTQARQEWWLSRMLIKSKLRNTRILIIHGSADRVVPYYCGEEIHRLMPWAQTVQVGSEPGQLPSLEFGHNWYEYFDIKVWRDVFETFLRSSGDQKPRL
ncbi:Haloacetate dehalogenase H [Salix suchowensis]|nr:Haloacetate dehalogenase H [Salix suchowensis]